MRWLPLIAVLLSFGCNGSGEDTTPSDCAEGCRQVQLIPCRDACDLDCGGDDQCRDTCHGDCLGRYEDCLADECGE